MNWFYPGIANYTLGMAHRGGLYQAPGMQYSKGSVFDGGYSHTLPIVLLG